MTCFLPCRKGSERVLRKNTKPFAGRKHGLIQIKLNQLLQVKELDEIVLSTNDEEILNYAEGLNESRIILHKRNEELSSSETSTDNLVVHALSLIKEGHIMWTHTTSPFVNAETYEKVLERYQQVILEGYDSLMTTTEIFSFLWKDEKPFNYDRSKEKWPRTQTLAPVHEVNSAVFVASVDVYKKNNDRIGNTPFLYPINKLLGHDIDWPEDFVIAECIVEKGLVAL